jgi:hypothetical protein
MYSAWALGDVTLLQVALEAGLPRGELKTKAVGAYFRQHKDQIVGGFRLRNLRTYRRGPMADRNRR